MSSVADAIRQHAPAYLQQFGASVPLGHRKVIDAIRRCRTGELGHVLFQCESCRKEHWAGRSCGNRHCPTCGHTQTLRWLEKQTRKLLPVHHFLVTFTVPKELRSLLRSNQREGYRILFDAGSQAIRDLGESSKYLKGCTLGFFGVLHTWGRDPMVYHPHVHFVVPGGGVNQQEGRWQSTPENFLFPHAAMVKVYKGKFADCLRRLGLHDRVDPDVWKKTWTVDIKPVGDGKAVLKYLAPYVHRVAISDKRIVACDGQSVTFRYTPTGKKRSVTRNVTGTEFVRGFVQHTLPSGFQKVRYYGWMSPNCGIDLDEVRWLVWLSLGWTYWLAARQAGQEPSPRQAPRCQHCGGELRCVLITDHQDRVLYTHALPYLDSG